MNQLENNDPLKTALNFNNADPQIGSDENNKERLTTIQRSLSYLTSGQVELWSKYKDEFVNVDRMREVQEFVDNVVEVDLVSTQAKREIERSNPLEGLFQLAKAKRTDGLLGRIAKQRTDLEWILNEEYDLVLQRFNQVEMQVQAEITPFLIEILNAPQAKVKLQRDIISKSISDISLTESLAHALRNAINNVTLYADIEADDSNQDQSSERTLTIQKRRYWETIRDALNGSGITNSAWEAFRKVAEEQLADLDNVLMSVS